MRRILVIALFTVTLSTYGQHATGQVTTDSSSIRPAFIGLFVNDISAMKTWYEQTLGFKVLQYRKINDQLGFAMLEWNGIWIEMIQNPKTVTRKSFAASFPDSPNLEGYFKLGFYAEDLEGLERSFKSKGVSFKYPMMNNDNFKMKLFIIEDPEGNWIQFYKIRS